jgi:rhodanese-related sulfurtransferase
LDAGFDHDNIAILWKGYEGWQDLGYPTVITPKTTTPQTGITDPTLGAPSVEELTDMGFVRPELPRITVERLKQFMDDGVKFTLIDVRDVYQYRSKHIPQAISLPLNTGDAQIEGFLALPKDELIFIY